MRNILLDALPDQYQGWLIRTDFRIGVQIAQAFEDVDLTTQEAYATALRLLFGRSVPPPEVAMAALQWFMRGGKEPGASAGAGRKETARGFDFDYDDGRIYSAFRRAYGIDLHRERLHWFVFLYLMGDLGDCALTQIAHYRTADLSKMGEQERKAYEQMRKRYAIPEAISQEDQRVIAEFMAQLEGG